MKPLTNEGIIGPPEEGQTSADYIDFSIRVQSATHLDNGTINYPETLGHEIYLHLNNYLDDYVKAFERGGSKASTTVYNNYLKDNWQGYQDHLSMANKSKRSSLYYTFINQLKAVLNPSEVEKHVQRERIKNRNAGERQKRNN